MTGVGSYLSLFIVKKNWERIIFRYILLM
jgi:hypothetical protein